MFVVLLTGAPEKLLSSVVPSLVKTVSPKIKAGGAKVVKARVACFSLLTELVNTLPGALGTHFESIIPGLVSALSDKSSPATLKTEALAFSKVVLHSHSAVALQPHLKAIAPSVLELVNDKYYKASAVRTTDLIFSPTFQS